MINQINREEICMTPEEQTEILNHFDSAAEFKTRRGLWRLPQGTTITDFCLLAKAVHEAGLDWYFTDVEQQNRIQVRFGRRERGKRASAVLGKIVQVAPPKIVFYFDRFGKKIDVIQRDYLTLTHDLVNKIVDDYFNNNKLFISWKIDYERHGYWSDDYDNKQKDNSTTDTPIVQHHNDDNSTTDTPTQDQKGGGDKPFNRIYYGPPGTGKTYALQQARKEYRSYAFVTFHQSYGYEEFVEGLRPMLNTESSSGQVRYEIRLGAFKKLCDEARKNPKSRYAMLIDEINRGNISKIFGELITLIETNKRGLEIELAYSGEKFSVPANVDIIGAMNTADRSLALVDTALRRRFEFISVMPDTRDIEEAPLYNLRVVNINLPKMLEKMNERIEVLYDRDHIIGHAYFINLKDNKGDDKKRFDELKKIFRNQIIPLLEEYFFEDWEKIRLVLGDNQKPEKLCFVTATENNLIKLFGNNHGPDTLAMKKRFALNDDAFNDPDAYIGIYSNNPTNNNP